jgi:hypothetical protein
MKSLRLLFVLSPLTAGCAAARPTPPPTPSEALASVPIAAAGTSSVLGRAELKAMTGTTVVEAIRQLRPRFLEGTQPPALNGVRIYPSVYVESRPFAGLETLGAIPIAAIDEVRFLKPFEARTVYGRSCACDGGVIVFRMRLDDGRLTRSSPEAQSRPRE